MEKSAFKVLHYFFSKNNFHYIFFFKKPTLFFVLWKDKKELKNVIFALGVEGIKRKKHILQRRKKMKDLAWEEKQ